MRRVKKAVTRTPRFTKLPIWKMTVTDIASPISVNPAAPHPRGVLFFGLEKTPPPEAGELDSAWDQYLKVTLLDVVDTL